MTPSKGESPDLIDCAKFQLICSLFPLPLATDDGDGGDNGEDNGLTEMEARKSLEQREKSCDQRARGK